MLATFGLRLACGMAWALLLLSPDQVNPRFYRTHFLTILGLLTLSAVFTSAGPLFWVGLGVTMLLAFGGSLVWSLDGAPLGRTMIVLTALATVATLIGAGLEPPPPASEEVPEYILASLPARLPAWRCADELTAAALLGAAVSAMLMGHSYLLAPNMSLTPLLRLLGALFVCIVLRAGLAGFGLWTFADYTHGLRLDDVTLLWLPVRWGLAFVGPVVLGILAWKSTRIRSTQSATGILYVVVIFCFLGELTSQLLRQSTGFVL